MSADVDAVSHAAIDGPPGPSRDGVDRMFDRIAARYDLANRVLSMGLDIGWRARLLAELPTPTDRPLRVLDVATGTADLAIALAKQPEVGHVTGVDISPGMLAHGREKVHTSGLDSRIDLQDGDATKLEAYRDFDVVTISFGIRNVRDTQQGLRGFFDALRPGGRALILEFGEPTTPVFAGSYRLYRKHILPVVGGLLTGDRAAYRYLDDTIRTFPCGEVFLDKMRRAGFVDVRAVPLTFGSVMLYVGTRPDTSATAPGAVEA